MKLVNLKGHVFQGPIFTSSTIRSISDGRAEVIDANGTRTIVGPFPKPKGFNDTGQDFLPTNREHDEALTRTPLTSVQVFDFLVSFIYRPFIKSGDPVLPSGATLNKKWVVEVPKGQPTPKTLELLERIASIKVEDNTVVIRLK